MPVTASVNRPVPIDCRWRDGRIATAIARALSTCAAGCGEQNGERAAARRYMALESVTRIVDDAPVRRPAVAT